VPLPERALDPDALGELCRRFEDAHLTRYGHAFSGEFPVEIVNLRLVGSRPPQGVPELRFVPESDPPPEGRREAYFGFKVGSVAAPVVTRSHLGATPRRGPLIIEEYDGTAVVPPDCTARLDAGGNVLIELPGTR
jgi:N-methylhydantoinase A